MKLKLKRIVALLGLVAAAPSFAAIANGASGNGELFLVAFDSDAKVSYTLDLGVFQDDFLVLGNQSTGYSRTWSLTGDSYFTTFLANASAANTKWSVLANETTGGTAEGKQRTFTTIEAGADGQLANFTNQVFSLGTGGGQMGQFFNAINTTGSHGTVGVPLDYAINGSSVNFESDSGKSYFGELGGLSETFNGNAPFSNANAVGTASSFYYLTRSGTDQLAPVAATVFGNADGAGKFLFSDTGNGYTLTYTLPAVMAVPEPETYALMLAGLAAVVTIARRRKTAV